MKVGTTLELVIEVAVKKLLLEVVGVAELEEETAALVEIVEDEMAKGVLETAVLVELPDVKQEDVGSNEEKTEVLITL